MGRRRKARELALQLLYRLDLLPEGDPLTAAIEAFWAEHPVDQEVRAFAEQLVRGTKANQAKIDECLAQFADRWELSRMAVVDRNILRAGIYELLWCSEIPPKVAINEALEIAKKFSTGESTRFINGVLDRVRKELVPP
ncbi:MAG: transcription antitermination factor NusB [Candidatus Rokubacteria bacterium]|nr:transcription antitermination factor NusB [Candidatus Rokubacteria bacterium]